MNKHEINIRNWYKENFPEDKLGGAINKNVTFEDVYICIDQHQNLYNTLGVGDLIIRERVIRKLSHLLCQEGIKVSYTDIYQTWLGKRASIVKG